MKKFISIMLGDIKQENFGKAETIIFAIVVPLVFIILCILADTIINKQQY